ncbi:hypothetical protein TCON_1755 [Astathelohania contejeani]|uniref:N-alpha-acetyltransferase 40 n=1 Tax=Astathelohania contejeani TaxID=164912 RepID=A0ABQ7HXY5_9MICR|nr:hypothetical protein TCON_1755 [Thelohania contejeani]
MIGYRIVWKSPNKKIINWAVNLIKTNTYDYSRAPCLIYNKKRSLSNKKSIFIICYLNISPEVGIKPRENETPVGFAMLRKEKDGLFLYEIHVDKNHQNQGIGSEMMLKCIKYFNNTNFLNLILFVHKNNKKAINFYKKHGFVLDQKIPCSSLYYPFKMVNMAYSIK